MSCGPSGCVGCGWASGPCVLVAHHSDPRPIWWGLRRCIPRSPGDPPPRGHVLVIGFLPQGSTGLLGGPAFHLRHDRTDRRGGYHPPVFNGMEPKDQMNVVWHNDRMADGSIGIDRRNITDGKLNDLSVSGKPYLGRAADSRPYGHRRQDAPPVSCAYGNKIGAGAGIIMIRQTRWFSFGQLHSRNSLSAL